MTEPTDAELDAVLCNQWPAFSMQATLVRVWVRAAMRDALAKWATPPALEALAAWNRRVAPATMLGEPVFAFRRKGLDDFCTCTEKRYAELSLKPKLFETRIFYTTQQPTQAQAGAVPQDEPDYGGESCDYRSYCKKKGGQHGAE